MKVKTLKVIKKQLCCYGEHVQQPAHNWVIKQLKLNTPIAQFFPPLFWLSEMGNRNPSGGVKKETKTFFRYFLEDFYHIYI